MVIEPWCLKGRVRAGFQQAGGGVVASGPFPMYPAGAFAGGGLSGGVVPGGAWPAANYGLVWNLPQWAPATSMALFVPGLRAARCSTPGSRRPTPPAASSNQARPGVRGAGPCL